MLANIWHKRTSSSIRLPRISVVASKMEFRCWTDSNMRLYTGLKDASQNISVTNLILQT